MDLHRHLSLALAFSWLLSGCGTAPTDHGSDVTMSAPQVIYPPDGLSSAPTTTVLAWRAVQHAFAYDVEWGTTNSAVGENVVRANGLTVVLPDQPAGTEVFWRVRAVRGQESGSWTPVYRYTALSAPHPVSQPIQVDPPNGVENMPTWAILQWEPVPGALSYHVIATIDADMLLFQADREGIEDTQFHLPSLIYTYPYWWKVRALGPDGYGPWSPVWIFTVRDEP